MLVLPPLVGRGLGCVRGTCWLGALGGSGLPVGGGVLWAVCLGLVFGGCWVGGSGAAGRWGVCSCWSRLVTGPRWGRHLCALWPAVSGATLRCSLLPLVAAGWGRPSLA